MKRLRVPAVIVIGCVWTLAFLTGVVTHSYTALAITTPVVLIAASAVFAIKNGYTNGGNG